MKLLHVLLFKNRSKIANPCVQVATFENLANRPCWFLEMAVPFPFSFCESLPNLEFCLATGFNLAHAIRKASFQEITIVMELVFGCQGCDQGWLGHPSPVKLLHSGWGSATQLWMSFEVGQLMFWLDWTQWMWSALSCECVCWVQSSHEAFLGLIFDSAVEVRHL